MDRSEEACREEGFSRMKSQNQKSFAKNESSASVRHVPIKKSGSDFPQDSFMSSGWERFDKACRQMDEELRNTWDMDMKDSMDDKFFKPTKRYSPHLMETVTKKSETKRSFIREETRFSSTDNLVDKKDDFLPLDDKNLMTNIREDSKVFELTMDVRNFGKGNSRSTIISTSQILIKPPFKRYRFLFAISNTLF